MLLGRFKPGTGPESSDPFRELQGLGTPKGWLRKAKKSLSWASDKQHQKQEHGKFSSPPAQAIIQAPLRVAAPENNGDDEQGSEVLEGWVNVAHSSGGRNNEEEARPAGSDAEIEPSRGTELFDNQNGSVTPKRGEDDHGIVARGIPKSADALKASVRIICNTLVFLPHVDACPTLHQTVGATTHHSNPLHDTPLFRGSLPLSIILLACCILPGHIRLL